MVVVTPAEPNDVPEIAELLEEIDLSYGTTKLDPLEEREEQIRTLLFRDAPAAYVIVAREREQAVGLAAYSFVWPAVGITQSLYLKELYVAQSHRRNGIGRALMGHLHEFAKAHACSRVEWTTDRDNEPAREFYERLGFEVEAAKLFFRISIAASST